MKAPSRTMPPPVLPQKPGVGAWVILGVLAAWLWWLVMANAVVGWTVGALGILWLLAAMLHHRRDGRMKVARRAESICTFARALPARAHDTWVVRATYEELSRHWGRPIRPTDDLHKDLCFHPDDLEDVALEIARRAGRSMAETKGNPMFDRVKTVADLVAFFEYQPRIAEGPDERDLTRGSIG